jgi:hypothetical protein
VARERRRVDRTCPARAGARGERARSPGRGGGARRRARDACVAYSPPSSSGGCSTSSSRAASSRSPGSAKGAAARFDLDHAGRARRRDAARAARPHAQRPLVERGSRTESSSRSVSARRSPTEALEDWVERHRAGSSSSSRGCAASPSGAWKRRARARPRRALSRGATRDGRPPDVRARLADVAEERAGDAYLVATEHQAAFAERSPSSRPRATSCESRARGRAYSFTRLPAMSDSLVDLLDRIVDTGVARRGRDHLARRGRADHASAPSPARFDRHRRRAGAVVPAAPLRRRADPRRSASRATKSRSSAASRSSSSCSSSFCRAARAAGRSPDGRRNAHRQRCAFARHRTRRAARAHRGFSAATSRRHDLSPANHTPLRHIRA